MNDTHLVEPASWNLYAYVRNNPLRYTDPTGERIYAGRVTGQDRADLLERLNYTYGCTGCVSIDDDGFIQVNSSGLSQDVLNATQDLTRAINDPNYLAFAFARNGSDDISFALAVKGGVEYKGKKYDAIYLDFKDDKALVGDDDVKKSFTYLAFFHELLHIYPPPGLEDKVTDNNPTGPVEDKVNELRLVRGLPLRSTYYGTKDEGSEYYGYVWFGTAKQNKNRTVQRDPKANNRIKVESKKLLQWNRILVKGIN